VTAKMTDSHPAGDILKLNAWMKDYATKVGAVYMDYYSVTVDERGWLKDAISADGLHPNAQGVEIIVQKILPSVEALLKQANR